MKWIIKLVIVINILLIPVSISMAEENDNRNRFSKEINVEEIVNKVCLQKSKLDKVGLIKKIEVCSDSIIVLFYNNYIAGLDLYGNIINVKSFDDLGGVSQIYYLIEEDKVILIVGKPAVFLMLDSNLNVLATGKSTSVPKNENNYTAQNCTFAIKQHNKIVRNNPDGSSIVIFESKSKPVEDYFKIYVPYIILLIIIFAFAKDILRSIRKKKSN